MFHFRFLTLIFAFFIPYSSLAIYPKPVPLGDNDYLIYENKEYKIIFDRQYEEHFERVVQKVNYYFSLAQSSQGVQLSEPVVFLFLSDKLQISNASASLFPFFQNVYYPSGVLGKDLMASPYWMDTTLYHEITHIFQIQHSFIPYKVRRFIKSPVPLFFIFLSIFPNQAFPQVIPEGDAVLKESMIGKGGRLYSGFARALVYSQIKKHNVKRLSRILINQRIHPHNGNEKYFHGGYIFLYLQKQFSKENLNKFFKTNALDRTFLFFNFSFFNNRTLRKSFKSGFQGIIQQYIDHYKKQALLQKTSTEEILFQSATCPPFNIYGDNVYFMTSNLKNQSSIRFYNKKIKNWFQRKTSLPLGKLFRINEEYYSRASRPVNATSIRYSLFSESSRSLKFFDSKYVEDIRGKSVLYVDSKNSFNSFKLYLNQDFYSLIHSNALFDSNKNIYYFKQDENLRTLYRNKQPLFSYPGYYGNILDIDSKGAVYFTASTPYGSSIFKYKDRKVTRTASSDTIIRGRKIGENQFLVCEVSAEGFDYKIISTRESEEHPTFYNYRFNGSFEDLKDIQFYDEEDKLPPQNSNESFNLEDNSSNQEYLLDRDLTFTSLGAESYKRYRPLRYLKYSSFIQSLEDLTFSFYEDDVSYYMDVDVNYYLTLIFSDELQKNNILINYRNFNLYNMSLSLSYENRVYRLTWEIGYLIAYSNEKGKLPYRQDVFTNEFQVTNLFGDALEVDNFSHAGFLNLRYPLFRKGYWSSSLVGRLNLGVLPLKLEPPSNLRYLFSVTTSPFTHSFYSNTSLVWNLNYLFSFPLSLIPQRSLDLSLFAEHAQTLLPEETFTNILSGGSLLSSFHLGYNFYLQPSFWYIYSSKEPLVRVRTKSELLSINLFDFVRTHEELFMSKEAGKASLAFLRPFELPYLSKYILSLTHLIPFFEGSYKYLNSYYKEDPELSTLEQKRNFQNLTGSTFIFEWESGIEFVFLILYNTRASVSLSFGQGLPVYESSSPSSLARLNFKSNF